MSKSVKLRASAAITGTTKPTAIAASAGEMNHHPARDPGGRLLTGVFASLTGDPPPREDPPPLLEDRVDARVDLGARLGGDRLELGLRGRRTDPPRRAIGHHAHLGNEPLPLR